MEVDHESEEVAGYGDLSDLEGIALDRISRDPLSLKNWLWYIDYRKSHYSAESLFPVYEKAVKALPGSYKLWYAYLDLRVKSMFEGVDITIATGERYPISRISLSDPSWEQTNDCFERSMFLCNRYPVIWKLYCSFLACQRKITRCRRCFDRALCELPVTQHDKIWPLYLKFAIETGGLTVIAVWRRYIMIETEAAEKYVDVLMSHDPPLVTEAVRVLLYISTDPKSRSILGKNRYEHLVRVCEILCEHAELAEELLEGVSDPLPASKFYKGHINIEKIIRSWINKFGDHVSQLWNSLARIYISKGFFEKACDVYDEAIKSVKTMNDFSILFDAYAMFEEKRIEEMMKKLSLGGEEEGVDEIYVDIKLLRLEKLMEERHILLNDVLLRQNPNNVTEWVRRVAIYEERLDEDMIDETYRQAIDTINPKKCDGKLYMLYVNYAEYRMGREGIEAARNVYEKAIEVPYRRIDDLVSLWKKYAEMEIEHNNYNTALELVERAVTPPEKVTSLKKIRVSDSTVAPQRRLFKSIKMWEYCLDLNESLGTFESTKAAYDRVIYLRVCTPQIIINYAIYLEDNKMIHESYKVYERGIDIFGYPVAYEILNVYLSKFIKRYGASKVERVREIYEQALEKCTSKHAKSLYLTCAKYEEDCGFIRHSMRMYERALAKVDVDDLMDVYTVYINKIIAHYGLPYTRDVYQKAVETLPDTQAIVMSMRFASTEARLGEVDRARTIYAYASQMCNPKLYADFWKAWYDFEVKHGNEDTFKEMLRIQRSVETKYNTEAGYLSLHIAAVTEVKPEAIQP